MSAIVLTAVVVSLALAAAVAVQVRRARLRGVRAVEPAPVSVALAPVAPVPVEHDPGELGELLDGFARAFRSAQRRGDGPIKMAPMVIVIGEDGETTGMSWSATMAAVGGRSQRSASLVSVAAIRRDGPQAAATPIDLAAAVVDRSRASSTAIAPDLFAAFRTPATSSEPGASAADQG